MMLDSLCPASRTCVLVMLVFLSSALSQRVVDVRETSPGLATVQSVDLRGNVLFNSTVLLNFQAPLVQMTAEPGGQSVWVVSYSAQRNDGPLVTQFDSRLSVVQTIRPTIELFDLQFSAKQLVFYGILVTSRYGRALTRFTFRQGQVQYARLSDLPYMWYINASTFDQEGMVYYGLLNNFPGFTNSTSLQKLAIGDLSNPGRPKITFVDTSDTNDEPFVVHYIAWSRPKKTLVGIAEYKSRAFVVLFNRFVGFTMYEEQAPLFPLKLGPLVARPDQALAYALLPQLDKGKAAAQMVEIELESYTVRNVTTFPSSATFWAAVFLPR